MESFVVSTVFETTAFNITTQYLLQHYSAKVSHVMQYYEKELDKQHSPLGKHATTEKHQGMFSYCVHYIPTL